MEKNKGNKTVFVCPLCDAEYNDYNDAYDCLVKCATISHDVEERSVKGDLWVCTDCKKEFNTLEEANKHPLNCLLVIASKHKDQTKLI